MTADLEDAETTEMLLARVALCQDRYRLLEAVLVAAKARPFVMPTSSELRLSNAIRAVEAFDRKNGTGAA